jgi:hypothetical protein
MGAGRMRIAAFVRDDRTQEILKACIVKSGAIQ